MIHIGRFRAITFLIAIVGTVVFWNIDVAAGVFFFIFMIFVALAARMLSAVMLAITGKPLLYDVKTTMSKDGTGKSY